MEQTKVRVRRAVREDAPLLAWAVLESTRGHQARGFMDVRFSFLLPEREDEVLRVLQQMAEDDAPTCVRWDGFLVAELDRQAAAVLCCCGPREKPFDEYYALVERVVASQGWPAEWVDSLHQKMQDLGSVLPSMADESDHWMIEWVATKPEFRRRGLVNRLLLEALEIGKQSGYTRAQISAVVENVGAVSAYKKVGFAEYNTVTSPLLCKHLPISGVTTLRMQLLP